MIINLRGTSGSGKTYAVRKLLVRHSPIIPITNEDGNIIANCIAYHMQPIYVIGDYTGAVCGGCDGIARKGGQNIVCSLVRYFSQFGHVIFEGLLISGLYARYAALNKELRDEYGEQYVWAFLDTPIERCIGRVLERRKERGEKKPFNDENTRNKHRSVLKCKDKALADGFDVRDIRHDLDVSEQLLDILLEDAFPFEVVNQNFR